MTVVMPSRFILGQQAFPPGTYDLVKEGDRYVLCSHEGNRMGIFGVVLSWEDAKRVLPAGTLERLASA